MRVVLDTNVLISGIFFHGVPGKILDAWVDGRFFIYATRSILEEYGVVIMLTAGREELLGMEWFETILRLCHIVPDPVKVVSYTRDPKDDKFISCALDAKADYLVSGDKDILSITGSFPFEVVSPAKFLSRLIKK